MFYNISSMKLGLHNKCFFSERAKGFYPGRGERKVYIVLSGILSRSFDPCTCLQLLCVLFRLAYHFQVIHSRKLVTRLSEEDLRIIIEK